VGHGSGSQKIQGQGQRSGYRVRVSLCDAINGISIFRRGRFSSLHNRRGLKLKVGFRVTFRVIW